MVKNLYFTITNNPADAAGDAIMINADTFLGMIPATATTTEMYWNKVDGTADLSKFTITHANGAGRDVMIAVGEAMSSAPKDGFIIIHDDISGESVGTFTVINAQGQMQHQSQLITSVAFTTL